jgi:hypothetical protein
MLTVLGYLYRAPCLARFGSVALCHKVSLQQAFMFQQAFKSFFLTLSVRVRRRRATRSLQGFRARRFGFVTDGTARYL